MFMIGEVAQNDLTSYSLMIWPDKAREVSSNGTD